MGNEGTAIRYPMRVDASLGSLGEEHRHEQHIEQLVRQLLFTAPGERMNRPDFGCGVRRMVFDVLDPQVSAALAEVTVLDALERWLGDLIRVDQVRVETQNSALHIHIAYTILARAKRQYLDAEMPI